MSVVHPLSEVGRAVRAAKVQKMTEKVTAGTVRSALRNRHRKEVFIEEVKNGRSWGSNLRIMDAWALKLSWSPVATIGYEIKVSRQDFLQDNKWPNYLKLCHQLYFVAPKGLIAKEELPPEVGLLELLGKSRLVSRKKAPYRREVNATQDFENLLLYLAMRCGPVQMRDEIEDSVGPKAYWEKWLQSKRDDLDLGRDVGREMRRRVLDLKVREDALETREAAVKTSEEFIREHGLKPDRHRFYLDSQLARLRQALPEGLTYEMDLLAKRLTNAVERLKEMEKQSNAYQK